MSDYRICFAGTPEFAAGHLAALLDSPHNVVAAYTQPDRPTGRGRKLQPSPVKSLALSYNIPVFQPDSLKPESVQEEFAASKPDVLIVVAYGLILPQAILDIPAITSLNVHASLLPRWRGAAPIERALLAGDEETGVTIMKMEAGLDTGPMLYQSAFAIGQDESREILENRLLEVGKYSLLRVLNDLPSYLEQAKAQDEDASSYANKLEKHEALIDWQQPAAQIHRQVRAGVGRNPAYTYMDADRLRILDAGLTSQSSEKEIETTLPGTIVGNNKHQFIVRCGYGCLAVRKVQLPGKTAMSVADIQNARPQLFANGSRFSPAAAGS